MMIPHIQMTQIRIRMAPEMHKNATFSFLLAQPTEWLAKHPVYAVLFRDILTDVFKPRIGKRIGGVRTFTFIFDLLRFLILLDNEFGLYVISLFQE